jgi:N4-gp56 family major capsid protein
MADFHATQTDNTSVGDSIISLWNDQTLFEAQPLLVVDQFAVKKSGTGGTMYFPKFASAAAATTPLTDSEDVAATELTDTKATLTAVEQGFSVTYNIKAEMQSGRVNTAVTKIVGINMGTTQDALGMAILDAFSTTRIYPNAATSAATCGLADNLDAKFAARLYNKLRRNNVPAAIDGMYAGIAHDDVLHDLRNDVSGNAWVSVSQYSNLTPILQNEVGMYQGIRWFTSGNASVTADSNGTIDTYKVNVLGFNALGKFTNIEPHIVIAPPTDSLQRFYNVGWYGLFVYGIIDTGNMVQGICSSSIGDN